MAHSNSLPYTRKFEDEPLEDGRIQFGRGAGMRKLVFIADDDSGQRVTKIATVDVHRRKLVLIQPYESSLYESGLRAPGVPGYVYVFAHASAESIQRITKAKVLADLIRRTNFWNNKPVLIDACNAGASVNGIACRLSIELGTYVTAPTTQTWNYPKGGSAVGQGAFNSPPGILGKLSIPDFWRPGTWRTWGPDGEMTGEARTSPRDTGRLVSAREAQEILRSGRGDRR